jgi:hypothetical protein
MQAEENRLHEALATCDAELAKAEEAFDDQFKGLAEALERRRGELMRNARTVCSRSPGYGQCGIVWLHGSFDVIFCACHHPRDVAFHHAVVSSFPAQHFRSVPHMMGI